jgi:hypothetical protein
MLEKNLINKPSQGLVRAGLNPFLIFVCICPDGYIANQQAEIIIGYYRLVQSQWML